MMADVLERSLPFEFLLKVPSPRAVDEHHPFPETPISLIKEYSSNHIWDPIII